LASALFACVMAAGLCNSKTAGRKSAFLLSYIPWLWSSADITPTFLEFGVAVC
jgi:hypothetical protein